MYGKCCLSIDRDDWQCKAVRSRLLWFYRAPVPRRWQLANCFPRAKRYAYEDRSFSSSVDSTLTPLNFQPRWKTGTRSGKLLPRFLKGTKGYHPRLAAPHTSLSASQTVRIDWNFAASVARQFSRIEIDGGTSSWSRIWRDVPLDEENIRESCSCTIAA